MQQYQGTPYANLLASVFGKLTAQLENEVTIDLRHLQQSFSVRASTVNSGDAELFDRLNLRFVVFGVLALDKLGNLLSVFGLQLFRSSRYCPGQIQRL